MNNTTNKEGVFTNTHRAMISNFNLSGVVQVHYSKQTGGGKTRKLRGESQRLASENNADNNSVSVTVSKIKVKGTALAELEAIQNEFPKVLRQIGIPNPDLESVFIVQTSKLKELYDVWSDTEARFLAAKIRCVTSGTTSSPPLVRHSVNTT